VLEQYFPILIFFGLAMVFGLVPLVAGWLLGDKKPDPVKNAAYECGFAAFDEARAPFDVRFYLVAILFILFDLETAFFFPWAVVLRKIGWPGFMAMMVFLSVLVVGFVYEWKKGALEWE
jgi:NADH-quinone oxidoreductase subunit A